MADPEEDMTLMDAVNTFATLLGLGQSLEEIFGGGGPDFQGMLDKLLYEVKTVFLTDLSDAAAHQAAGVAQAGVDFLTLTYVNAKVAHESDEQLWATLNDDGGPKLSELDAQAATMVDWANDNPKAIAQKTASLALTIYSLIVAIRRERAAVAPKPEQQAAEMADMRSYAEAAVSRVEPLFDAVSKARLDGISDVQQKSPDYVNVWFVTDSWFADYDSDAPVVLAAREWGSPPETPQPNPDAETQCRAAYSAYLHLLGSGSDDDAVSFQETIGDAFDGRDGPSRDDLINMVPSLQTTGKWLACAPGALKALAGIAAG